jgi:hypothetical protein
VLLIAINAETPCLNETQSHDVNRDCPKGPQTPLPGGAETLHKDHSTVPPSDGFKDPTDRHDITHELDTDRHGHAPIQVFGTTDSILKGRPDTPSEHGVAQQWPEEPPPALRVRDADAFKAGSLTDHIAFWRAEILPYLKLDKTKETEILRYIEGVHAPDFFKPYTGYAAGRAVVQQATPPPVKIKNHKMTEEDLEFVREDVKALVMKGAAKKVRREQLTLIQPLGVVTQLTRKRLIYDARYLNIFCNAPDLQYETLNQFAEGLQAGDRMWKVDLKDGFHIARLTDESTQYFGFELDGEYYAFMTLPFGWNCSPYIFQTLTRALSAYTARTRIQRLVYLDDFSWAVPTGISKHVQGWLIYQTYEDLYNAGFFVSVKKSTRTAETALELLGFTVDSTAQTFRVPPDKKNRLFALIDELAGSATATARGRHVKLRQLEAVTGKCQSLALAVPTVSLFLRHAYTTIAKARQGTDEFCFLPVQAIAGLQQLKTLDAWSGLAKWPQAFKRRLRIFTDACSHSWGVSFLDEGAYKDFHGEFPHFKQQELRIHTKEHLAVKYAFELLPAATSDTLIDLYTDNTIVQHTTLKGSAKDKQVDDLALYLMQLQLTKDIKIRIHRVSTTDNVRSDWLSRLEPFRSATKQKTEYMLTRQLFLETQVWAGQAFTIDGMATMQNRQTERYISLVNSDIDRPVAVNVFSYDFKGEFAWLNPPWVMIPAVWAHLRAHRAHGVILVPESPQRQWWPMLQREAIAIKKIANAGQHGVHAYYKHGKPQPAGPAPAALIAAKFDFRSGDVYLN